MARSMDDLENELRVERNRREAAERAIAELQREVAALREAERLLQEQQQQQQARERAPVTTVVRSPEEQLASAKKTSSTILGSITKYLKEASDLKKASVARTNHYLRLSTTMLDRLRDIESCGSLPGFKELGVIEADVKESIEQLTLHAKKLEENGFKNSCVRLELSGSDTESDD